MKIKSLSFRSAMATLILSHSMVSCVSANDPPPRNANAELIDLQYKYYMEKNLEKFLSLYDDKAEVCFYPAKKCYQGIDEVRALYKDFFGKFTIIEVSISNREIFTNMIKDIETVRVSNGAKSIEKGGISIYTVRNQKITMLHIYAK